MRIRTSEGRYFAAKNPLAADGVSIDAYYLAITGGAVIVAFGATRLPLESEKRPALRGGVGSDDGRRVDALARCGSDV